MSSKNSVTLIKDLLYYDTTLPVRGGKCVQSKELNVTPHPDLISTSRMITDITTCFQDFATKTWNLLAVYNNQGNMQMNFEAQFNVQTLQPLCNISSHLYLEVSCKLQLPTESKVQTFNKRLELADILGHTPFLDRWRLFSPPIGDCLGKKATFDIILGWREPLETMKINTTAFMKTLFEKDSGKDLVICAANGAEMKCHRIIFEAHSDILAAMISPNNGMQESKSGRIKMTENSEEGLSYLLRYLYGMELATKDLPCDVAVELFKTSEKYKLTELQECLGQILLQKKKDWFSPDDLLELYFHAKNLDHLEELHEHLLSIILSVQQEIRSCEGFQELERTDGKAATSLVWKLFDLATS